MDVQERLADRGHHRAASVPDLLIAATAELSGLTVLHLDKDFELIADVTGQTVERLPPSLDASIAEALAGNDQLRALSALPGSDGRPVLNGLPVWFCRGGVPDAGLGGCEASRCVFERVGVHWYDEQADIVIGAFGEHLLVDERPIRTLREVIAPRRTAPTHPRRGQRQTGLY